MSDKTKPQVVAQNGHKREPFAFILVEHSDGMHATAQYQERWQGRMRVERLHTTYTKVKKEVKKLHEVA